MSSDDQAIDLLRLSANVSRWATRHATAGRPWAQVRVLALVEDLGPARVGTLAVADDTSQPTMTTAIQRLVAEGLVDRVSDPEDGRASLVSLTTAGASVLQDARAARARAVAPLLQDIDPARVQAAVALLQDVVDSTARPADEYAGPARV